jgi:hypothetical protein
MHHKGGGTTITTSKPLGREDELDVAIAFCRRPLELSRYYTYFILNMPFIVQVLNAGRVKILSLILNIR